MTAIRAGSIFKRIILILIIGLTGALQYNTAGYFAFAGVVPNLMLVAAVMAGYTLGSEAGGFAGLLLGLYQDAQSGKILGMYALIYLYIGVIAGFFPKKSNIGDFSMAMIAVYTLTLLNESAVFLFAYAIPILRGGLTPGTNFTRAAFTTIIPLAFINVLWSAPYYFILYKRKNEV